MSTDILMLSWMIDVVEVWDIATADITGAFLKTDYNKLDIDIKIEGEMVTLLEDIYPAHYKYFIYKDRRSKKFMYAESKKDI